MRVIPVPELWTPWGVPWVGGLWIGSISECALHPSKPRWPVSSFPSQTVLCCSYNCVKPIQHDSCLGIMGVGSLPLSLVKRDRRGEM